MYRYLVIVTVFILVGCVENPPVRKAYTPKAEKWEPIMEGSQIKVDANYEYEMKLSNGRLLRHAEWKEYLKPFVSLYPQKTADTIIDGITRYYWEYDRVEKKIKYEPLRYINEPYSRSTYVSMQGTLTKGKAVGLLKFKYYGESWIFAERVKIVADDYTWQSPDLKFYRDNYGGNVWEYAFLDISSPINRKILDKIVTSKETIVRFQGKQYYSDVTVSVRMKEDLIAITQAIDAVNEK